MAEVGVLGNRSPVPSAGNQQVDLRPEADASVRRPEPVDTIRTAVDTAETKPQQKRSPENRESVERVTKQIRKALSATPVDLRIVVAHDRYMIELVDSETGDVVRRVPPEWFKTEEQYRGEPQGEGRMPPGVLVDQNG